MDPLPLLMPPAAVVQPVSFRVVYKSFPTFHKLLAVPLETHATPLAELLEPSQPQLPAMVHLTKRKPVLSHKLLKDMVRLPQLLATVELDPSNQARFHMLVREALQHSLWPVWFQDNH